MISGGQLPSPGMTHIHWLDLFDVLVMPPSTQRYPDVTFSLYNTKQSRCLLMTLC